MNPARVDRLLADFESLVASGALVGRAAEYLGELSALVDEVWHTGDVPLPADPFKGDAAEAPPDPATYYTMFWRMFDRTPAALLQAIAIPMRRILAKKIFRHCGDGVIFHHDVLFSRGSNISVGNGALVNRYTMLDDRGPITIGAYTMIAAGVTIETHTHPFDDFSRPIAYSGRGFDPVSIGANSVIGYNAVLMAGTTVGYRAIVAANTVVTSDVPDFTVVGGVPARPIKTIRPADPGEDLVGRALDADPDWRDHRLRP